MSPKNMLYFSPLQGHLFRSFCRAERDKGLDSQMKRIASLALALLLLGSLLAGCKTEIPVVTRTSFLLDTIVTITLYDWHDATTMDQAMEEIGRLEALLSVEKEGSDLDRLAKAAGKDWVEIAPETQEVLTQAKEFYTLSGGYFDVTAGPLIDLWGIRDQETGHFPTDQERQAALSLINNDDLLVEDGRACLTRPGMKVNLGGIAKGYIADKVKRLLVSEGVEHAVIDLGRNILLIGGHPNGQNFPIGIQDPLAPQGTVLGKLEADGKSVVTSGTNERYFVYEGKRYHHVLDPFTGFPSENGVIAVTILSDSSIQGDALSTTCLLLGLNKGMDLIESLPDVEALFILEDGTQHMTGGFHLPG